MINQEPEQEEKEKVNNRGSKRNCIFTMMGVWFFLLAMILLIMFLVRNKFVTRDVEGILQEAHSFARFEVPARFKPYSLTKVFGKTVLAFWDEEHVREDDRALAVIALFADRSWEGKEMSVLEKEFVDETVQRLAENEFHVLSEERFEWQESGKTYHFQVYTGRQRIGEELVDASSCYRFMTGQKGYFQMYTLGIDSAFSKEDQISFLKSVVPE